MVTRDFISMVTLVALTFALRAAHLEPCQTACRSEEGESRHSTARSLRKSPVQRWNICVTCATGGSENKGTYSIHWKI